MRRLTSLSTLFFWPVLVCMIWFTVVIVGRVVKAANDHFVEAALKTLRDEYHIVAEAKQIRADLMTGDVTAIALRLSTESGKSLLTAAQARISFPSVNGNHTTIRIVASDGTAWIRRDADGLLEFQKLLPKRKKKEPLVTPVDVSLQRFDLHYDDATGERPKSARVYLSKANAQVIGFEGRVTVKGTADHLDRFSASAHWAEKTGMAVVASSNAELGALLQIAQARFKLDALKSARAAKASGPVSFALSWGEGKPAWIADGKVAAGSVQYGSYGVTSIQADITVSEHMVSFSGDGDFEGAHMKSDGFVKDFANKPILFANGTGSGKAVERFWKYLRQNKESPVDGVFRAGFWIGGPIDSLQAQGDFAVANAHWEEWKATAASGFAAWQAGHTLDIRGIEAMLRGSGIEADAAYDLKNRTMQLAASTRAFPLSTIKGAADAGLSGTVAATLLFDAPIDKPEASINVSSPAISLTRTLDPERPDWSGNLGAAAARVVWSGDTLIFPVLRAEGPNGRLQGSGIYNLDNKSMSFAGDASGVELDALRPTYDATGTVFASFKVSGTTDNPSIDGLAEVFAPAYDQYSAALASAKLSYADQVLTIERGSLRKGAAQAAVNGMVDFTGDVSARELKLGVRDLDPALLLKDESPDFLHGFLHGEMVLNGPFNDLAAIGKAQWEDGTIDKIPVDSAAADLVYRASILELQNVTANIGGGTLTGSGHFGRDSQSEMTFRLADADLSTLNGYIDPSTPISGLFAGGGELRSDGKTWSGSFDGSVTNSSVGNLELGGGELHAQLADNRLRGSLALTNGRETVTVAADNVDFDKRELTIRTTADLHLEDLRLTTRRLIPEMSDAAWVLIRKPSGGLHAEASATGSFDELEFPFRLTVPDFAIDDHAAGQVSVKGTALRDLYKFDYITWTYQGGQVLASGSASPDGAIVGGVEIAGLDLSVFQTLHAELIGLRGTIDATAQVSGATKAPDIDMTLDLTGVGRGGLDIDRADFGLITVRDGEIRTDAAVIQKFGYVARLSGSVPFTYKPFGFPTDLPIHGELVLPEQDLAGLRVFWPEIDAERTNGRLFGADTGGRDRPIRVAVGGTLHNFALTGELDVSGTSFAIKDVGEGLKDISGVIRLNGEAITLESLSLSSASGGKAEANARINVQDGLNSPISGDLKLTSLTLKSHDPNPQKSGTVTLNGTVSAQGTLKDPLFVGVLGVASGTIPVPENWESKAGGVLPAIDPRLNISVQIAPGTEIRSPRMDAKIRGTANVSRSVYHPKLTAEIHIMSGSIRVPTMRLALQPGSSLNLEYDGRPGQEPIAAMQVNLRARTSIVTANAIGSPVTYRIDMQITGSLLEEDGLRIHASSSPPDLPEAQIMALLGQQGFLESIGRENVGKAFQQELKDILGASVLPALFEAIDPNLAQKIGLEAFGVTYNRFEPLTLNLTKSLFDGVNVSYRRSLEGVETLYQVKLSWQLPIRHRFLGNFSLGYEYDQQRLGRITLEWGRRF